MGSNADRIVGGDVVDRGIEQAWSALWVRVADWLDDEANTGELFVVDSDRDDPNAPIVEVMHGDPISIDTLPGADEFLPDRYDLTDEQRARLENLGFETSVHLPCVAFEEGEVDLAAHALIVLLRDVWGVVHPSFLTIEGMGDDAEPEPAAEQEADLPDLVHPTSVDDLREWVERTLQPGLEHPITPDDDGDYGLSSQDGGRIWVSVRDHWRVEVWTVLARDVRRGAAEREAGRLGRKYFLHRFFVDGTTLIASRVIDAAPFAPRHLHDLCRLTLKLHAEMGEKMQRRVGKPALAAAAPHSLLAAIAGNASGPGAHTLVETIAAASGSDPTRVLTWLEQARSGRRQARKAYHAAEHGPMRSLHAREWRRWDRTVQALKVVRDRIGADAPGHESDRSA